MDILNFRDKIFSIIKKKNYEVFFDFIKKSDSIRLDIQDDNYNYVIDYLINDNQYDIIEYILKKNMIRLDILDSDNKNILFKPIKFNNIELINLILKYDKENIGISILEKKDIDGYNVLFYSCIYNNFESFKIFYDNNSDIYCINEKNENLLFFLMKYNRNKMLIYLIDKELQKNNNFLKIMKSNNNDTILQNAIIYDNNLISNYLLSKNLDIEFLNNQESEYGLTVIHNSIILKKTKIIELLISKNIDINLQDYLGNSPLHYCVIENNLELILLFAFNDKIRFNSINLNGNTPLHLLLNSEFITYDSFVDDNEQFSEYKKVFLHLLKKTKINYQNNLGQSIFYLIVEKELWKIKEIKEILITKKLNIFIEDNESNNIISLVEEKDKEEFLNLIVNSYYYYLKNYKKNNLKIEWENYCSKNNLTELMKILRKKGNKDIEFYCKEKIRDTIINENKSIPQVKEYDLNIDFGIYKAACYYTGSTLDILFGLVFLFKTYSNVLLLLEYPLIQNDELKNYYNKLGININYKLDFSNIEIIWLFQKIIYPTNFDSILVNRIQNIDSSNRFLIIPLGIETQMGSHANIIIIDNEKKIIERFEPNGYYSPRNFYFNEKLLDEILENKFNSLLDDYQYIRPSEYLPIISFQILESLETEKCKKIEDPNGFCAVWCIWWVYHKIKHENIKSKKLAKLLINKIKFNKLKFKEVIRNFSQKITEIRDEILEKNEININDWINNEYSDEILSNIEKDVLEIIR